MLPLYLCCFYCCFPRQVFNFIFFMTPSIVVPLRLLPFYLNPVSIVVSLRRLPFNLFPVSIAVFLAKSSIPSFSCLFRWLFPYASFPFIAFLVLSLFSCSSSSSFFLSQTHILKHLGSHYDYFQQQVKRWSGFQWCFSGLWCIICKQTTSVIKQPSEILNT